MLCKDYKILLEFCFVAFFQNFSEYSESDAFFILWIFIGLCY